MCFYICHSDDPNYIYKGHEEEWNLKVWHNHDWVFIPVALRRTDVDYIRENCSGMKCSAPVLEKHDKSYYLRFTFTWKSDRKFVKDRAVERAVGVDLGINTDAVCSLVLKNGTVAAREFIDSPAEKDRLYKNLRVIRHSQKQGNFDNPRLWRFVNHYNDAVEINTARKIVNFAVRNYAQVIVFEHLGMKGRKVSGSKAQRITMWRKNAIQNRVEEMASRVGIRTTHVCARNTSALVYDDSGPVTRDPDNHALCTFATGKRYNCDLSASYNIGARYFIRVLLKTVSAKKRLSVTAKVPGLNKRTTCTLSTLINLSAELKRLAA